MRSRALPILRSEQREVGEQEPTAGNGDGRWSTLKDIKTLLHSVLLEETLLQ